jgi:hypothetical protein
MRNRYKDDRANVEIFAHLSVLISIIHGLGLSHLLTRVGELFQARAAHGHRVHVYWVQMAWVLIVFVAHVQLWWALFFWTERLESATYFQFMLVLLGPVTLFLASRIVLPDLGENPTIDLRRYFDVIRPWFFTVLALYPIVAAITEIALEDWTFRASRIMQVALSALLFPGALIRSERFHKALVLVVLALALVFIGRFTLRLA